MKPNKSALKIKPNFLRHLCCPNVKFARKLSSLWRVKPLTTMPPHSYGLQSFVAYYFVICNIPPWFLAAHGYNEFSVDVVLSAQLHFFSARVHNCFQTTFLWHLSVTALRSLSGYASLFFEGIFCNLQLYVINFLVVYVCFYLISMF